LPVELIFFDAWPKNKTIFLKWITSSETENKGFEIWRAETPPEYINLGWREGNGTTSNTSEYDFIDEHVETNKTYYYQLKQVDYNGLYNYSNVVTARLSDKGFSVSALPNPYIGTTHISLILNYESAVNITIFSAIGQEVTVLEDKMLQTGIYNFDFSAAAAGWGQGVYTARIVVDGEAHYLKLLEVE
jgi:hypothetical protein